MSKTTQKLAKNKDARTSAENSGPTNSSPARGAHDHILSLQQSLGNHGVGRLLQLGSNHAGVSVGPTGDHHEQQAEQFAQEARPSEKVAGAGLLRPAASAPANSRLASEGQPLPETLRESLEARFGHDLNQVRVHTNGLAAESAKSINAAAFTVGHDVVFGAGQYAPETSAGQSLIAHEMAHVVQQGVGAASAHGGLPLIQRSPLPANLELPWSNAAHSLFEVTSDGIRVLVGVGATIEAAIRKVIPGITKRVSRDNALIKDAKFQVKTVFIASGTTRFALLHGEPALLLDPADADVETAAHEMGHAIFHYLSKRGATKEKDAGPSKNFTLQIADIYARLSTTKSVTMKNAEGKDETHQVGLWMVDPTQWKKGGKAEHPYQDPDEFFGSAKEAYQTDRKGLQKSIDKAIAIDSTVKQPAKELMALLDDLLGSGKLPATAPTGTRLKDAEAALAKGTGISNIEDTARDQVLWLIDPTERPVSQAATPGVQAPTGHTGPPKSPNMVTKPGGVIDQMKKRQDERMREKILESVNEL